MFSGQISNKIVIPTKNFGVWCRNVYFNHLHIESWLRDVTWTKILKGKIQKKERKMILL
jgi:hypothetical protein